MHSMSSLPALYTLKDLADEYGWSLDTLYDYVRRGDLPASRIGRSLVVTGENLATFLANRAVHPGDDDLDQPASAPSRDLPDASR